MNLLNRVGDESNNTPMLSRDGSSTGSNTPSGHSNVREEEGGREEKERDQEAFTPVVSIAKEKILELILKKELDSKPVLSLVVVGTFFISPFLPTLFPPSSSLPAF